MGQEEAGENEGGKEGEKMSRWALRTRSIRRYVGLVILAAMLLGAASKPMPSGGPELVGTLFAYALVLFLGFWSPAAPK